MKVKQYQYSEIFKSIQGEGKYTGVPTLWYRAWGCNFECSGFGQESKDESTWVHPHKDFDLIDVKVLEELPVWEYGCDSSYTWSLKYRNLAHRETAEQIVNNITALMVNEFNPKGLFNHPGGVEQHMAFTGGEPMMSQHAMVAIMDEFVRQDNVPAFITVETNGTQCLSDKLIHRIESHGTSSEFAGLVEDDRGATEWFWSVSPKLSASGEKWDDAIKPEVVAEYAHLSNNGQLKYVVDGTDECWAEVEKATAAYREAGVMFPVWIMPVGATVEGQDLVAAGIAEQAIDRGYNVAARVHCYIWGNKIGT